MRCTAHRLNAHTVTAAMARASRNTPSSQQTAQPLPHTSTNFPHLLTSALQSYAQRRRQRAAVHTLLSAENDGAANGHQQTPDSRALKPTFAQLINVARANIAASLADFKQSLAQQREEADHAGFPSADAMLDSMDNVSDQEKTTTSEAEVQAQLRAAMAGYNPTVNETLLKRVGARLAIADTLLMATQLVRYLHDAAAIEATDAADGDAPTKAVKQRELIEDTALDDKKALELVLRAMDVCRTRYATAAAASVAGVASSLPSPPDTRKTTTDSASAGLWAWTPSARESAGITARFHSITAPSSTQPHKHRRPPQRAFLRYTSDVQVSEVLETGAVVVFTHRTHSEEVGDRAAGQTSEVSGKPRRTRAMPSFRESLEHCLASSPAEIYIYFVLYREGLALTRAVAEMVDSSDGLVTSDDIAVHLHNPENDVHVVVQLCSVRVAIPPSMQGREHAEDAMEHCLHVARTLVHVNFASVSGIGDGEHATHLGLQLLDCRLQSCAEDADRTLRSRKPGGSGPQVQYAVLLRGLTHRGGPADQLERTALTCCDFIPNFFAPHHFGPPVVPFFRTYHVAAALEHRLYAEAAAMLLCLEVGSALPRNDARDALSRPLSLPPWLTHALRLLYRGEEREGVWQTWWMQHVPHEMQTRLPAAKADLVWNVLASGRLQQLAAATGGRRDALLAAPPEPGDFVRDAAAHDASDEKEDCDTLSKQRSQRDTEVTVVPVFDRTDAARYTVHDIVLPVVRDAMSRTSGCETVAEVEAVLGFSASSRRVHRHRANDPFFLSHHVIPARPVPFRPLFTTATGYPRASRPWSRSFQEPASTSSDTQHAVFALATDWTLAASGNGRRDYAAQSRGPRAQMWPLSKRGRALSDRLPVGLLAAASATGSSLLGSSNGVGGGGEGDARRHTSRCLAIHCTLPADVSLGNYLCELTTVEDLRRV